MNNLDKFFSKMNFRESRYIDPDGYYWNATTLYEFAKEKGYKPFELPLEGINLSFLPFDVTDLDAFIWQIKRVLDVDLKYPIILNDKGEIVDGYHRICKAFLNNKKTIKAIRLLEMPKSDGRKDEPVSNK